MQALKEWAVVCKALEEGRQVILLRKGGILEYRQGFEVRHDRFALFPTFEHQSRDHLQPDYAAKIDAVQQSAPAAGINRITSFAEVKGVAEVTDKSVLKRLEKYHVWNESYVNARMDYNPKKPMSVILLRVFRLDKPLDVVVDMSSRPEWAGCRSWIPFDFDIDTSHAKPVLDDTKFNQLALEVREALSIVA